jgi:alpha-ketoglutarate-dependent taurine dioxygenase
MTFTIDELAPFGIVVTNTGDKDSFDQFSKEQIATWVAAHKVVLFRGYAEVSKQRLALFAQKLGKPLQWPFGAINDLKFKPDAENYIFTNREVPVHWDGAFRGTVPHIILFQCIKAPEKEDLGGTTFVHTEKILDRASAPQLKEWGKLSITYKTEKIVHYGGEITQKFIDKHEVGKQEVIRYAEAVHDLNPVALSIEGLEGKSSAEFTAEIKELLYDPANLYTHRW